MSVFSSLITSVNYLLGIESPGFSEHSGNTSDGVSGMTFFPDEGGVTRS